MKLSNYPTLGLILSQVIVIAVICLFGSIGFYFYVGYLAFLATVVGISFFRSPDLRRQVHYHERHQRVLRITARVMLFFFLTGAILYAFAIRLAYPPIVPNAELVARSLRCSLDLFALNINSNILDRIHTCLWLKGLIALQGAFSLASSVALLFSLLFTRLRAWYMLHRRTTVRADRNRLYIFFGMDYNSRLLARDISRKDKKAITVFVDFSETDGVDSNDSWTGILNIFTHRRSTFVMADEAQALVAIASRRLRTIEQPEDFEAPQKLEDMLGQVGLSRIASLISSLREYPEGAALEIFILSDNEDDNVRELMTLMRDTTIRSLGETNIPHRISVHARRSGPNSVIEDVAVREGLRVEIVDSSELAVNLLKENVIFHPATSIPKPWNYDPVCVDDPLNALIVGFDEVGRDAFRFLYEFGTFIGQPGPDGIPVTLKPRITAVDARMTDIEGPFRASMPALDFESGELRLLPIDAGRESFYSDVLSPDNCRKLNYIVIASDNSDANIGLAVTIFNRLRKYREDMTPLTICVRCVADADRPKMEQVADHFNYGRPEALYPGPIFIFGYPSQIYTFDMLVNNRFMKMARQFNEKYRLVRGGADWDQREKEARTLEHHAFCLDMPDIDKLRALHRKRGQDLANAYHVFTKFAFLPDEIIEAPRTFVSKMLTPEGASTFDRSLPRPYPNLSDFENLVMDRLAVLEHARWNAAHELMGYVRDSDGTCCDEREMHHNCLVSWAELDDVSAKADYQPTDYKSYDYGVVETSILILRDWL